MKKGLLHVVFLLVALQILPVRNQAQSTAETLDRLNRNLERSLEANNLDSFVFYSDKKILTTKKANQLTAWIEAHIDLQDVYADDPEKALAFLDQAVNNAWRAPASSEETEQWMYLQTFRGYHLTRLSRIWPAIQAYESARTLFERFQFGDFEPVDWMYKPLGNHYTRLGDNEKALIVFQKALTFAQTTDEKAGLYTNIALAHWNAGQLSAAKDIGERGLQLQGLAPEKRALLLGVLALVSLDAGDPRKAIQQAEAALALLPASSDRQRLVDRVRIGRTAGLAYLRLGQVEQARRMFNRAFADARRAGPNLTARDLAKLELASADGFMLQNQPQAALEAANRALSSLLPGFRPKAREENPRPDQLYPENTLFEALICKADAGMAMAAAGQKWLTMAMECHEFAFQVEQQLRHVLLYESSKLDLQAQARIREEKAMAVAFQLYRSGEKEYLNKGLEIAERSKAALLQEALVENLLIRRPEQEKKRGQLVNLRRSVALYQKQLLQAPNDAQAAAWREELDRLQASLAMLTDSMHDLRSIESQFLFGTPWVFPGETVVEYFTGNHAIDVFTVKDGVVTSWTRINRDAEFNALLERYYGFFADGNAQLNEPAAFLQTAYALWNRLLPEGDARTSGRLIVVPDGFLHHLPFEALVCEKPNTSTTLRNARYLLWNQQVRYAWSMQVLNQQNALPSVANRGVLSLAPVFANRERGLAPLPNSKNEWTSLPGGVVDAFTGAEATLVRFSENAPRYKVLHVSTHAWADTTGTRVPGIEWYDGSMLLQDVYALPLHADLVVLSACETGMGAWKRGEGVMSFARAFTHAGAASVVSSLWQVNDQATSSLMEAFYTHLVSGLSVAEALHTAKLHYLKNDAIPASRQTPYFWAGMVAVGADRKVALEGYPGGALGLLLLSALALWLYFISRKNRKSHQSANKPNGRRG